MYGWANRTCTPVGISEIHNRAVDWRCYGYTMWLVSETVSAAEVIISDLNKEVRISQQECPAISSCYRSFHQVLSSPLDVDICLSSLFRTTRANDYRYRRLYAAVQVRAFKLKR